MPSLNHANVFETLYANILADLSPSATIAVIKTVTDATVDGVVPTLDVPTLDDIVGDTTFVPAEAPARYLTIHGKTANQVAYAMLNYVSLNTKVNKDGLDDWLAFLEFYAKIWNAFGPQPFMKYKTIKKLLEDGKKAA